MESRRALVLWFFGAMVVFPATAYVFSGAGLFLLSGYWFPPFASGSALVNQSAWLVVGFLVVFALFLLSVARWGAPSELWVVAAAWSALHLVKLLEIAAFVYGPLVREFLPPSVQFVRFFEASAFRSALLYFIATFGFLGVAALGCWVGARWRTRRGRAEASHLSHA